MISLIIIFLILMYLSEKNKGNTKQWRYRKKQNYQYKQPTSNENIDYKNAYQSRYLLSKNELFQYKKLKTITDKKSLIICPKVRLLDIIEPKHGSDKYKTLFYKVQAKHVDFVVCNQDMQIKAIIELDDNSHDRADRKERDEFVDTILKSVGYRIIHTRYITDDILDMIEPTQSKQTYTGVKSYPTGWTYNENTHLWEPPKN